MRLLMVLTLWLCCAVSNAQVLSKTAPELKLRHLSTGSRDTVANMPIVFWILPFARVPVAGSSSTPGYSPDGGSPADWLNPVELDWNFGDGTKRSTMRGMSATHQYKKPGNYTVRVIAKHGRNKWSGGKLKVSVKDSDNLAMTISATASIEDSQSIQFGASSFARPRLANPAINYEWDFGDGEKIAGKDLWNPVHRYSAAGKYKVVLTATDASGIQDTAKKNVRVVGAINNAANSTTTEKPESKIDPETVLSQLSADISGSASGTLLGAVRPIAKTPYYLVGKGNSCRLKLSFWDDAALASGYITFKLVSPPVGGARYAAANPVVALTLYANAKRYLGARQAVIGKGDPVGSSPFGLTKNITFRTGSGSTDLVVVPGEYVTGNIDARLNQYKRTSNGRVPTGKSVSFSGQFSIKLGSLQDIPGIERLQSRLGDPAALETLRKIRRGNPCVSTFDVKKVYPTKDVGQLKNKRPIIWARFTQSIAAHSVSKETFQVGYPDPSGKFVPTAGRYLADTKKIRFVPDEPLKRGVHYEIRIKSGVNGVKSANGSELSDEDGTGWRTTKFTTTVDVQIRNYGSIGCNIYQSAKDVPLIKGKPAIARVHLRWPKLDDVHPDSQVKEFKANITVGKNPFTVGDSGTGPVGVKTHTFIRPDLYKKYDVNLRQAQDTAQVPFVPTKNWKIDSLAVWIDAMPLALKGNTADYLSFCQYESWDKAPEISILMHMVNLNDVVPESNQISVEQVKLLAKAVKEYAWQQLPVRKIKVTVKKIDRPNPMLRSFAPIYGKAAEILNIGWEGSNGEIFPGYAHLLKANMLADIHIVVAPHSLLGGGANTYRKKEKIDVSNYGVIVTSLSMKHFSRNVMAAVHEIGHALSLDHIPYSHRESITKKIQSIRHTATINAKPVLFDGIEGFRMNQTGRDSRLKSSTSGNSEDQWLVPLMFPATVSLRRTFISNLSYRCLQEILGKVKNPACPQRSSETGLLR